MKTANDRQFAIGQISNQERGMRTVMGLISIVGVLTGSIAGEGYMFGAAMLCIYLGMTTVIGLDPFYFLVEKSIAAYTKRTREVVMGSNKTQGLRLVSGQFRNAA